MNEQKRVPHKRGECGVRDACFRCSVLHNCDDDTERDCLREFGKDVKPDEPCNCWYVPPEQKEGDET